MDRVKLNEVYNYREENRDLPFDRQDLPSQLITVRTLLSDPRVINRIRTSLKRTFVDCEIEERENVMTVSGYPPEPNYGQAQIMATVTRYDAGAQLA